MNTNTASRTLVATLALTVAAMAPMASAVAQPALPAAGLAAATNPGLIDTDQPVSLTIHKHLGAATGLPHDGTAQSVDLPTLAGVTFDVYTVTHADGTAVDLTTNHGWQDASAVHGYTPSPAEITAGSFRISGHEYRLVKTQTVTTGSDGSAVFEAPRMGLYFVNENLVTSTAVTDSAGNPVPAATITPAAPFFVTLPMTEPGERSSWMYDVHVYPKNQTSEATKSVRDARTLTAENGNAGDHTVAYTVRTSITDGLTAAQMGTYVVEDVLDARLGYVAATVGVDADGTGPGDVTVLSEGGDYMLTAAATAGQATPVRVEFTAEGLAKLAAANTANSAAQVVTTIETTVQAQGATGMIANTATFIPNQAWADANPGSPGQPTPEVRSYYGDIVVTKFDPQDAAAAMAGAEFAVHRDADADGACAPGEVGGTPLSTATVGSDNKATIRGLQTSDWYDGKAQDTTYGYCLVETKAPQGYNLDAEPRFVTIGWQSATDTTAAFAAVDVANEKTNLGNKLPLTGGAGVAGMSLLGLALVGGGAAYYVATNRRKQQA